MKLLFDLFLISRL